MEKTQMYFATVSRMSATACTLRITRRRLVNRWQTAPHWLKSLAYGAMFLVWLRYALIVVLA